jgi:branched-subunit amino acid transport protein AzlD
MLNLHQAFLTSVVMGAVVFFCRVFPFLFFKDRRPGGKQPASGRMNGFRSLVEKAAPPVTMTVLAVNAMSSPIKENPPAALPVLAASLFTALIHLWKRNSFFSILGGTMVYILLNRVMA